MPVKICGMSSIESSDNCIWSCVDFARTTFVAPLGMCTNAQDGELLVGEAAEAAKWILDLKEMSLTCMSFGCEHVAESNLQCRQLKTGFAKCLQLRDAVHTGPENFAARSSVGVHDASVRSASCTHLILLSKVAGPKRFLGRTWSELSAKQMCLAAPLKAQIVRD